MPSVGFSDDVAVTRFASGQIRGALRAAEAAEHVLLVIETGSDTGREARAVEAVLDRQVDGIVFAAMRAREIAIPRVPTGTPIVILNATTHESHPSVRPNDYEGGRLAIRAIADLGHREAIVLLGQDRAGRGDALRSPNVAARVAGIFDEMTARGLSFAAELPVGVWAPENGRAALDGYLDSGRVLTCVVALNDPLAFGAYQALNERGLRIPRDASVLSFDNDELAGYLRPGLTTIAIPYEEMGEVAVRMLLDRLTDDHIIEMPLIERASLGPPSR